MKVPLERMAGVHVRAGHSAHDDRGSFTKAFDRAGGDDVETRVDQVCSAYNRERGTVRGMHVQVAPHQDAKLVWCQAGIVWDVLVDTRPEEPTYGDWAGIELDSQRPASLYVPPGVAHGYQTLTDDVTLIYVISGAYAPDHARTLAWDDPTVGIAWPLEVSRMSDGDRNGEPWSAFS